MEITKKCRKYFQLEDIEVFIRFNEVPKSITDWGVRSNFKRACKNLSIENGQFLYKSKRVVIMEKHRQLEIKTSMKALAKAPILKLWLPTKAETRRIRKYQSASFGNRFTIM